MDITALEAEMLAEFKIQNRFNDEYRSLKLRKTTVEASIQDLEKQISSEGISYSTKIFALETKINEMEERLKEVNQLKKKM